MPDAGESLTVVALSDTHGTLPEVPQCDLLLIAGDVVPLVPKEAFALQAAWLDGAFREWLEGVPADEVVFVPGNHDTVYEWAKGIVPLGLRCHTLIDEAYEYKGLKVYGSPWQPWFWDWAFNAHEKQLASRWEAIPDDADVVVLHGPPHLLGDYVAHDHENPGSPSLAARLDAIRPALAVYGHIHGSRGLYSFSPREGARDTVLANVSVMDEGYKNARPPVSFRLDRTDGVWYATPQ